MSVIREVDRDGAEGSHEVEKEVEEEQDKEEEEEERLAILLFRPLESDIFLS